MSGLGQALAGGYDSRTNSPANSAVVEAIVEDHKPAKLNHATSQELKKSLGEDEYNMVLARAKFLAGLHVVKSGRLAIEPGSVYGAAILLPQVARTLKWPRLLTASTVKMFGFLILCMALHIGLLTLLSKEEVVVDALAGQPYLCDFGAGCEHKGSCTGPGGTEYEPDRRFRFETWSTRKFVKQSMKLIFQDRAEDIDKFVDPGEYGAETYFGRLLCCFVFITALDPEFELALNLARLLWYCPSGRAPWIMLTPSESLPTDDCQWWLEHVKVKIGSMPKHWKMFNSIFILMPRVFLYVLTCVNGITFLMETAVIDNVIINACALGFLLSLDNMVVESFASAEIKCLLERCEDLPIGVGDGTMNSGRVEEDDILHSYHFEEQIGISWYSLLLDIMPWKLLRVVVLTSFCVLRYYHSHCLQHDEGNIFYLVSRPMYRPTTDSFTFWNTFSLLFPLEFESKPSWTMPESLE